MSVINKNNNMTVSTSTPIKPSNSSSNNNNSKKPTRARQLFSFSELAGTDLTLLLDVDILLNIFSNLEFTDLFIVKRVCSRWKPLCENKSLYKSLDMQSFIFYCRILPMSILNNFLQTLSMDKDEIDALKMVCREMPKITFSNQNNNIYLDTPPPPPPTIKISTTTTTSSTTTTTTSTTTTTLNNQQKATTTTVSGNTTPPNNKSSIATAFAATTSSLKSFLNTSASGLNISGNGYTSISNSNSLSSNNLNGSNGSINTNSSPPSPNLSSNSVGGGGGGSSITTNNNNNINDDTLSNSSSSSNGSLSSFDSNNSINNSNTPTSSRRNVFGLSQIINEKEQKKKDKNRKEREKRMEESLKIWNEDMIPNWEKRKGTKKCRDLVLQGIPSLVRSKVWPLLIGNDLNISPELFSIFGARAERAKQKSEAKSLGREKTVSLIHLDLPRTFPMLSIFQDEGPLHQSLANVLEAYVCYRPDVGYVQGMSYLAAVFLLILDEFTAFVCLSNFLNNPCYMSFYTMNMDEMAVYMNAMDQLTAQNLPKIQKHLKELCIQPDVFMIDWVLTVFSKALPLDVASHVWDTIFLDGEIVIFQTALGILKMYSKELETGDFDVCMTLLTHLPQDIDEDELFSHINSFQINPKVLNKLLNR